MIRSNGFELWQHIANPCFDALKILFQLEKTDIQRPVIVGLIGLLLYYEKDDIEKALPYLKESVSLSPKSERASLGLFHALWEKNNIDEAFNEMKRFMKSSDSKEYRRLLAEINAD